VVALRGTACGDTQIPRTMTGALAAALTDAARDGGIRPMTTLPASTVDTRPLRFEAWPDDTRRRAYELWSSIAVGSAPRTEHLLAQEAGEGVAVPAASTIRAWAASEGWPAQRDEDRAQTHGRTLRELQAGFLSAVVLAENTMLDAMVGLLDGAPYGGSGRIKAAEAILRLAERSGVRFLATAMELEPPTADDDKGLTLEQRARRARARMREANARSW
jgi:hypothetical protein